MKSSKPPRLRSFLLRCWEERGASEDAANEWRFSLEEPGGKRRGFVNIESLMQFLEQELRRVDGENDD